MSASRSFPANLNRLALLLTVAIASMTGFVNYLLMAKQIDTRLAAQYQLIEARFAGVLAHNVWDLDLKTTQGLLDDISQLDGVNRVELRMLNGTQLESQHHTTNNTVWIRDFPIQSERSGLQPIATLRLYLGRDDLVSAQRKNSLQLAGQIAAAMLLILWLVQWQLRRQLLRPLDKLQLQLQSNYKAQTNLQAREIIHLDKQLQKLHDQWDEALDHAWQQMREQQRLHEQFSDLATRHSAELEQQTRLQQLLLLLSERFTNYAQEDREQILHDSLARIAHLFNVDRCYLISPEHCCWYRSDGSTQQPFRDHSPWMEHHWLLGQLRAQSVKAINQRESLPVEAQQECQYLSKQGVASLVWIKTGQQAVLFGCDNRTERSWLNRELLWLQLFAYLLTPHFPHKSPKTENQAETGQSSALSAGHTSNITSPDAARW